MWKYAAVVSYVGTSFCGWQTQLIEGKPSLKESVQQVIEAALSRMTSHPVRVVGSGRTDAGVHALGQVIHFVLADREWAPEILLRGMNGILPQVIRVLLVKRVDLTFHAQRSAIAKQYSYYFQQGPCALPHLEPFSWWIRKKLDHQAMQEALSALIGEHDFKPFRASGAKPGSSVRTVLEAQVTVEPIGFPKINTGSLVRVRVVGTGFLKQMVRGIAGTLLQVGEARRPPTCMKEILRTQDRTQVGPTAPARALWLEWVAYPEPFEGSAN